MGLYKYLNITNKPVRIKSKYTMTTFKQAMNSFNSYSDKAQSRDFEKISVSRVSKTAFDYGKNC